MAFAWIKSKAAPALVAMAAIAVAPAPVQAKVDLAPFLKREEFQDIKLSPTGEFLAATLPLEDRTAMAIIRRSDSKSIAMFALDKDTYINQFDWVNPSRLLLGIAEKSGFIDEPQPTGELYAVDADGSAPQLLVGWRVAAPGFSTRIDQKKVESVAAFLIDDLPDDDKNVLVSVQPFVQDAPTRIEKMDVYTGRRSTVGRAPVLRARYLSDHQGIVRFAVGADKDNISELYYRKDRDSEWVLVNDEGSTHRVEWPVGFAADGVTAYLQVENPQGPDSIVAYDTETGLRKPLLLDEGFDPSRLIGQLGSQRTPIGARYEGAVPRNAFFDEAGPDARIYRSLEESFPGQSVEIRSATRDGTIVLVETSSGTNPGDFYLFDVAAKKADYILSRRRWFDPEKMSPVRPVSLKARDGLLLHGFLTTPKGSSGKNLPMVVMPHGGPIGIYDRPGFDADAQLLAQAGYAVLQVNFRGSGGRGRAFLQAGAREWGGKMQDDVTDATRWAVQQSIADGSRVCIVGASYGAYAALMGVAREPDLYRCAVGYVGVYDLDLMHSQEGHFGGSTKTWVNEWVGERGTLGDVSPNKLAAQIKVPVFMAAGGEDDTAPIEHTQRMEAALRKAGVPVETLYVKTEGHGFYTEANRRAYYQQLLAFLARNIGGSVAKK